MLSLSDQIATILEFVLQFAGIAYLVWLLLSPGGRVLRQRAPALAPWDLDPAAFLLLALLVILLGMLGALAVPAAFNASLHARPEGKALEVILSAAMFPIGAILAWAIVRLVRPQWLRGSYDWDRPPPSAAAGLRGGFLTFIAVVPIVIGAGLAWEALLQLLGLPTEHQELVDRFIQARSPLLLGTMTALALVVAPIGEEMVFRAGLFRYLRTRLPRWLAFAVSAGVFAALHFNWSSFLPLFLLGVSFAVAYERTGRISVPIVAHTLFNLHTLLIVLSNAPV